MMTKSNQNHNIWRRLLTTSLWPDPCLCVSTLHSISLISVLTLLLQKSTSLQQYTTSACWHYERNNWNLIWKHADIIDNSSQKINTSLQWIYEKSHQPTLLSPSQLLPPNNLPPLISPPLDHSGVVRRVVIVVGNLVTIIIIGLRLLAKIEIPEEFSGALQFRGRLDFKESDKNKRSTWVGKSSLHPFLSRQNRQTWDFGCMSTWGVKLRRPILEGKFIFS